MSGESGFECGRSVSYPAAADGLWARDPSDVPTDEGGNDDHHLVTRHCETVAERCASHTSSGTGVGSQSAEFKWVTGYCHDFGKLTHWFQIWVRHGADGIDPNDKRRYHSDLGALLALYALEHRGFEPVDQVIAYATIKCHHMSMPDVPAIIAEVQTLGDEGSMAERFSRYDEQLDDIADTVPNVAEAMVKRATGGGGSFEDFRLNVRDRSILNATFDDPGIAFAIEYSGLYADVLQSYSELKFADVSHSAGAIDHDMIDASGLNASALTAELNEYKQLERPGIQGDLDDLRTQAQETIAERVEHMVGGPDPPKVGRIWLPTGFGKTIGGLLAAMRLSEVGAERDRVIYALPFTSIIDQVSAEIEKIFGVDAGTAQLIVHHYLSGDDSRRKIDDEEIERRIATSIERMLGTTWSAGCVVSTFVQLFESMIAPTGSQAPKLPALQRSVVILDEPQELPPRLWPLIGRMIEILVEEYDARVLLMTATQPGLVEYSRADVNVIDLIDDTSPYVEFLEEHPRVTYDVHESALEYIRSNDPEAATEATVTHTDAARTLTERLLAGDRAGSALAVCNTTASSQALFTRVSTALQDGGCQPISIPGIIDQMIDEDDVLPSPADVRSKIDERIRNEQAAGDDPVLTCNLTARHRPLDRRLILDVLTGGDCDDDDENGLLGRSETPISVVATRLIEAGVDIEFETVWRDIAPVPSIVQSGGRCNREFGGDGTGSVTIWRLDRLDESQRTPAAYIYGHGSASGMEQTRWAIRAALPAGRASISEADTITTVVEHYYDSIAEYNPGEWNRVTQVDRGRTTDLGSVTLIGPSPWLSETIVTRTSSERRSVQRLASELAKDREERNEKMIHGILADLREVRYGVPVPGIPTDDASDDVPAEAAEAGFSKLVAGMDIWHIHGDAPGYSPDHGIL